jgi:hypothetical protein
MPAQQAITLRSVLLLLTAASLLVWSLDSLWGTSTDLAHHYALVARLSELWTMPYSGNATLGEMNYYPRSSHIMAAIVGRVLGSVLLGMQFITLLSVMVLWASLASIVLSVPKKSGWIAAILLSAALWANRCYLHLELGADEVIENFFYAQLVAQAFAMLVVAISLALERRGVNPTLRYALLVGGIYVATGMHLLPALELLCFFAALVGVDLYQKGNLHTRHWRSALVPLLLLLGAAAALLTHPSFAAMSGISNNNGSITGRTIQSMGAFMAYSGLHMVFSAGLLLLWWRLDPLKHAPHWLGVKYIALFGLAVSGLCLLQVLALQLGHGSEYSVKKYIFALNTSLLIEAVLCVTLLIAWRWPGKRADRSPSSGATLADLRASALTVVAFLCVTPAIAPLDTSNLVALEHQLQLQRDLLLPNLPGKSNYLAQVDGLPNSVAYMMSIGVLKSPRSAHPDLAQPHWWIDDWSQVATVVTSQNSSLDQDPACRRAAPVNTLVMLDGACLARRFSAASSTPS